jgi:transcriptional regulator with XRE-family HTH domain
MQDAIGRRIRELRIAKGMTQAAVAERAETHTKYLGNIERGEVNLTVAMIERIAKALDVPVVEFFQGVYPPRPDRDQVRRLFDAILNHGDDEKVARLRVFLETVFR